MWNSIQKNSIQNKNKSRLFFQKLESKVELSSQVRNICLGGGGEGAGKHFFLRGSSA